MPGDGKAVARTVAVLAALLLGALALRGYLPTETAAAPPPPEPDDRPGTASPLAVVAMFAVALAIMALAVLAQPRRRRVRHTEEAPRRFGVTGGRPRWRLLVYAAAALAIWLTVILLLQRWEVAVPEAESPAGVDQPPREGAEGGSVPRPAAGSDALFGYLLVGTVAMVALSIVAGLRAGRVAPAAPPPVDDVDDVAAPAGSAAPDLARAAERGLAEIDDRRRDPREAIIACYAVMEAELEKSPGTSPRASDTPSEVLARAVDRHALRADSAVGLVELFEEARFSRHVMTEQHRAEALAALRAVQRDLLGAP
ncbi:DUF4129 domain-containing protein [Mycobacterium sp. SMC-4]|uniref:DUF4129 domain-containing protein n=1 Tax=Mycobacterium sp. SMC-4 TaxID=2857059 RepID=UPI0021B43F13|nr:DUF4129 domain-containing protein [Mycobacterium sp. SMC-4]UXA18315.1 DUF4129 domain-containing protein [Mycobacterium sp. SMC-4]